MDEGSFENPTNQTTYQTPQTNQPGAKTSVLIAGQWVCPDLFLRRPAHRFPESRLDRLLDARAKEVGGCVLRVCFWCIGVYVFRRR